MVETTFPLKSLIVAVTVPPGEAVPATLTSSFLWSTGGISLIVNGLSSVKTIVPVGSPNLRLKDFSKPCLSLTIKLTRSAFSLSGILTVNIK